ncbi:hypothetical protein EKO27_g3672 [Xylaria grammica]|uniref:GH16 domain-containing protein n=1 Tax=Xylaria grammica TaxID=363999 RepID=A0A439DAI3_9PEZI|nr:hypothetical protein EKO27_g3672 [Xylaria grammica]
MDTVEPTAVFGPGLNTTRQHHPRPRDRRRRCGGIFPLWNDGPTDDGSQFNEINFGYTVDGHLTDSQLLSESTRLGEGLEYDYEHVAFYSDGNLLHETTDTAPIPTDLMDLVLGPRIVAGGEQLTEFFLESFDWVEIE